MKWKRLLLNNLMIIFACLADFFQSELHVTPFIRPPQLPCRAAYFILLHVRISSTDRGVSLGLCLVT